MAAKLSTREIEKLKVVEKNLEDMDKDLLLFTDRLEEFAHVPAIIMIRISEIGGIISGIRKGHLTSGSFELRENLHELAIWLDAQLASRKQTRELLGDLRRMMQRASKLGFAVESADLVQHHLDSQAVITVQQGSTRSSSMER